MCFGLNHDTYSWIALTGKHDKNGEASVSPENYPKTVKFLLSSTRHFLIKVLLLFRFCKLTKGIQLTTEQISYSFHSELETDLTNSHCDACLS